MRRDELKNKNLPSTDLFKRKHLDEWVRAVGKTIDQAKKYPIYWVKITKYQVRLTSQKVFLLEEGILLNKKILV